MLSLTDRDDVTTALTDLTLDPSLRALIGLRVWQIDTDRSHPLSDVVQIVVVHPASSVRCRDKPTPSGSTFRGFGCAW